MRFALATLALVTLVLDHCQGGGHGGGHHKKVIIHVPYKIKHIHHTHTVYKHVHEPSHNDHDYYKVIGYSGGIDQGLVTHGTGGGHEGGHGGGHSLGLSHYASIGSEGHGHGFGGSSHGGLGGGLGGHGGGIGGGLGGHESHQVEELSGGFSSSGGGGGGYGGHEGGHSAGLTSGGGGGYGGGGFETHQAYEHMSHQGGEEFSYGHHHQE